MYTKPQDKQLSQVRLEVSVGSFKHSQQSSSVVSSMVSSESSLHWRDGPAADGELGRTLILLEQRHLDTLPQMAVRASTTMCWKSPSGRVDMSGIGGNGGSASIYRFSDDLEECGDFGVFWNLWSAELHRPVRCLAMDGDFPTSFDLGFKFHRFEVNQHPIEEVMPVSLTSGQSASREKAVEEMKDRRSMKQP
ncbi:hypothetical protein IGI04_035634, partial [Brassica rapa subsp. trilocularis]